MEEFRAENLTSIIQQDSCEIEMIGPLAPFSRILG
jgi:hypothetical protein